MDYSKKSKEELIEELNFLKKKEDIISRVLDDTNEVIYHVSYNNKEEKKFEYVSPHVERVMGISTEKYIDVNYKNTILEYIHPDDVNNIIEKANEISKKEKKLTLKYRFFNKRKKEYVWIEETIVASYRKNGKRAAIFGSAKDITEEIEKEKQLSFVLENIEECIYNIKFTEQGKKLNFVSPFIEKIIGLNKEEFIKEGKSGVLIKRVHKKDRERVSSTINMIFDKKLKRHTSSYRFLPKNKKEHIWLEERFTAVYDEKGKLKETTTILQDITKQKIVEKHLKDNEEKYRNIFSKNLAGVFITDKGKIVD